MLVISENFYISFKKPATIAESNMIKNNILKKIKPVTKKQKQLEAVAIRNNNSILNYALPRKISNVEKLSIDKETPPVEKEASSLEN